jgi:D-alanyl-D-alanine endopeptidase (penicillin-binding protein 7)
MISAAGDYALIRQLSIAPSLTVKLDQGGRVFHTTNRLVGSLGWQIELQKTGFISEAGNCLLLQARVDKRSLIVVLLDSYGRLSRLGDAERIRRWLAGQGASSPGRPSHQPEPARPEPAA